MTTGPIPLSDTPARCPDGCEHPLTVHSADRGCCLCDCVHGRRSGAAGSSGEDGGAIRSEAERRAAWRPGDDLSSVECRMLEMAEAGEPFDPGEGSERTIRAGVLRHLLVDTEWDVQPKGVQICGVQILGNLDLESANVRCPLRLEKCHLYGVILNYATVSLVEITHCQLASLAGHALVVTRDLNLDHSMSTERFWLLGADIAGQLSCREATLTGTENYALVADGMKVGGDVFFDGLTTNGVVSLVGANITGQLSCKGADLSGVVQALIADEIKVGGSVIPRRIRCWRQPSHPFQGGWRRLACWRGHLRPAHLRQRAADRSPRWPCAFADRQRDKGPRRRAPRRGLHRRREGLAQICESRRVAPGGAGRTRYGPGPRGD